MENYKFIKDMGNGHFSIVQKYRNIDDGTEVAIKKLKKIHYNNPEYRHRFKREIELTKKLNGQDNIVVIYEHRVDENSMEMWYMTELADINLYDYIRQNNTKLNYEDRVAIFKMILDAMSYSHDRGILHRDLSPNNVLVFTSKDKISVKICDFGLGKDHNSKSKFTKSADADYGQILYVAPEQKEKLKNATKASDVYSLGKLLYFVMTGKEPDIIRDCMYHRIVEIATSEAEEDRFEDAIVFRDVFLKAVNVIEFEPAGERFSNSYTIRQYIDYNEILNLNSILVLMMNKNVINHVFEDYIDPIFHIFSKEFKLDELFRIATKDEQKHIMKQFVEAVDDCIHSTGWPFNKTDKMMKFCEQLYITTNINTAKLELFKIIWDVGFEQDQWNVQDIGLKLLSNDLPSGIIGDVATHIKSVNLSGTGLLKVQKINLGQMHQTLRKAIISII